MTFLPCYNLRRHLSDQSSNRICSISTHPQILVLPYSTLSSSLNLTTVKNKRKKQIPFLKINDSLFHVMICSVESNPQYHSETTTPITAKYAFCRTTNYLHTFFPSVIRLCNTLPHHIKLCTPYHILTLQVHFNF